MEMDEETSLGEWQKVSDLGSGSFGVVSLWRHKSTNDFVAIKKCRWDKPASITAKQRERWTQEVNFMRSVQHPNIVAYRRLPRDFLAQLDRYNPSRLPLLPMEYCAGGNLRRLLNLPRNACGLREPDVRRVLQDLAAAVSHLHSCAITHRDIKPENVVLQRRADGGDVYKLIDLGYAKDASLLLSFVGTVAYTAPEIFMNEPYNHNVDYWSFGIVAYELCCGKHPFLPRVEPVRRFDLLAQKGPRDICVYQSQANRLVYTDKILEPNHLSACLRTHLEDWLGAALQYRSAERGRTRAGADVFAALQAILDRRMLHVFVVYTYTHHHYEIGAATTLRHLQRLVEESSGLVAADQLILTSCSGLAGGKGAFYARLADAGGAKDLTLLADLGLSAASTLYVLRRSAFVRPHTVHLPLAVRNLMRPGERHWQQLQGEMHQALHYLEEEVLTMRTVGGVVRELFEYLALVLPTKDELWQQLRRAGLRALHMVEFCRELTAHGCYDGTHVALMKDQRRQLRRARELIENANAAGVRCFKAKARMGALAASMRGVCSWMAALPLNSIYDDALECLNINKQKTTISSDDITPIICRCIKTRRAIQQDAVIVQHMNLCFKVLRQHDKLARWMRALGEHLARATADLLDAQKQLGRLGREQPANADAQDAAADLESRAADDLVRSNRSLRCKMQEALEELLRTHEEHATAVGQFVQFVDGFDVQ